MKTTLIHYHDNRMILVSDEEIKEGEYYLDELNQVNKSFKNNAGFYKDCRKVIAKDNSEIDLSQKVSDFLGIVDVEKLIKDCVINQVLKSGESEKYAEYMWTIFWGGMDTSFEKGINDAFQKAQELNKKLFTLEDMKEAIAESWNTCEDNEDDSETFSACMRRILKSLQSPKEYEVTCELDERLTLDDSTYTEPTINKNYMLPKITNGKRKVLTINK